MSLSRISVAAWFAASATAACLSGCQPTPQLVKARTPDLPPIPCAEARCYPASRTCTAPRLLDCTGDPVENQVCVNFASNGCIDSVIPEDVYVCPDDTVKWLATGHNPAAARFEVYFIPIEFDTVYPGRRPEQEHPINEHGPWLVRNDVPRGKARGGAQSYVEYKYTVRGGRANCTDRVFDLRIKIDPQ